MDNLIKGVTLDQQIEKHRNGNDKDWKTQRTLLLSSFLFSAQNFMETKSRLLALNGGVFPENHFVQQFKFPFVTFLTQNNFQLLSQNLKIVSEYPTRSMKD